jgi:hypothetical protein
VIETSRDASEKKRENPSWNLHIPRSDLTAKSARPRLKERRYGRRQSWKPSGNKWRSSEQPRPSAKKKSVQQGERSRRKQRLE